MGFFKDFKDDLSQAVNELLPEEVIDGDGTVNGLEEGAITEEVSLSKTAEELTESLENVDKDILEAILSPEDEKEKVNEDTLYEEEECENTTGDKSVSDEVTVITKSTSITGGIRTDGSLEVMGTIKGDIECQGKLSIIGTVNGNCIASEVYIGAKRFEGCITSEGSVKIGLGTVIIGDITATAGVIAGAVKGDVDISGPVTIDSSAVIKGNIKAESIQINNGAVIDGFCSLPYASIDLDNIFE